MGHPRTHEQLVSFAENSTITQENRRLWWVYVVVSAMYRGRYIWWKRKRMLRRWVLHEPRTQADKTPDGKKLSINDNACRTSIYLEGLVDEEKKRGVIPRFSPSQSSSLPLRFCQIPNWQLANRLHFRLSRWSVFGVWYWMASSWSLGILL